MTNHKMGAFCNWGWLAAPVIQSFNKGFRGQPSQPFRVPPDVQFVRINKKQALKTDAK